MQSLDTCVLTPAQLHGEICLSGSSGATPWTPPIWGNADAEFAFLEMLLDVYGKPSRLQALEAVRVSLQNAWICGSLTDSTSLTKAVSALVGQETKLRERDVQVGRGTDGRAVYNAPRSRSVKPLLRDLQKFLPAARRSGVEGAAIASVRLLQIHPYVDGKWTLGALAVLGYCGPFCGGVCCNRACKRVFHCLQNGNYKSFVDSNRYWQLGRSFGALFALFEPSSRASERLRRSSFFWRLWLYWFAAQPVMKGVNKGFDKYCWCASIFRRGWVDRLLLL